MLKAIEHTQRKLEFLNGLVERITYHNEIIHYIQECRNNNISMHQCIVNIVKKFRPELLG